MATLFITGGNRGIGLAILKRFAAEGYNIIVSTRKQYPKFEVECREIESTHGVMIHHTYMELDNPDSIAQGLKNIDALGIVPDVVVNNAGIFHEKILLFSKMEDIKKVFQVNYFSVLQITQYFAKAMMRIGGGGDNKYIFCSSRQQSTFCNSIWGKQSSPEQIYQKFSSRVSSI